MIAGVGGGKRGLNSNGNNTTEKMILEKNVLKMWLSKYWNVKRCQRCAHLFLA